jgi:hypothetical protein
MFGFKKAKPQTFADVLDEIHPAEPEADAELAGAETIVTPSQAQQPHDWLLQMLSGLESAGSSERVSTASAVFKASYFEDTVLEDAVEPLLEAIASCEQDAIAEELGLNENLSASELKKLRRAFARVNHPDRLAPSQREIATHRMTIANMLIDRELRQKSSSR